MISHVCVFVCMNVCMWRRMHTLIHLCKFDPTTFDGTSTVDSTLSRQKHWCWSWYVLRIVASSLSISVGFLPNFSYYQSTVNYFYGKECLLFLVPVEWFSILTYSGSSLHACARPWNTEWIFKSNPSQYWTCSWIPAPDSKVPAWWRPRSDLLSITSTSSSSRETRWNQEKKTNSLHYNIVETSSQWQPQLSG